MEDKGMSHKYLEDRMADLVALVIAGVGLSCLFAFWAGVVYVVYHFVTKYW